MYTNQDAQSYIFSAKQSFKCFFPTVKHWTKLFSCNIRYNINRNVEKKIFILDFGLQICLSEGDCILDDYLLKQFEFPIPLCGDFVLPGKQNII